MTVILKGFKPEDIPYLGIRNKRKKSTLSSCSRNSNNVSHNMF